MNSIVFLLFLWRFFVPVPKARLLESAAPFPLVRPHGESAVVGEDEATAGA
jgi:hypothetical protein